MKNPLDLLNEVAAAEYEAKSEAEKVLCEWFRAMAEKKLPPQYLDKARCKDE